MVTIKEQHGYSLIEVLLYVGILSIMATTLTGFFLVSLTGSEEHGNRDDIQTLSDSIHAVLTEDIRTHKDLELPAANQTGAVLVLVSQSNSSTTWSVSGEKLVRTEGGVTRSFGSAEARVTLSSFASKSAMHSRLGATTTLIQYSISLSHPRGGLTRILSGSSILGKQGL